MQKTSYVSDAEWKNMVGADLESTTVAATVAGRILSKSFTRCHNGIYGALSGYAGNMGCRWDGVASRFKTFKKLKAMSEEEMMKKAEEYKAKNKARYE
jgi:hypothetical protein